jgi:hypothetical protein
MAEWLAIVSGNTAQVFNAESGDLVSELRGHPGQFGRSILNPVASNL